MKKLGLLALTLLYLFFCFAYPQIIKTNIIDSCLLFVQIIMPSILPMYFIGNILLKMPLPINILELIRKLLHLENITATKLYLLSIIIGNPSTTILISKALKEQTISPNEAQKLLKVTFFMNPLFIINVCGFKYGISLLSGSLLTSIFICKRHLSPPYQTTSKAEKLDLYSLIQNAPNMLLNILIMMIVVTIIKSPFGFINNYWPLTYLGDCLDISSGLIKVRAYSLPSIIVIVLLSFLTNFNGFCLFLQTIFICPEIKIKSLFFNRLFIAFSSSIITLFIHLLFNC